MQPTSLIIVSPDASLVSGLKQSLSLAKDGGRALIIRSYPSVDQLDKLIRERHPISVIVGLSVPETALDLVERLHRSHPELLIATAHTTDLSDLILDGIRAGAREYIGPPFKVDTLKRVLTRRLSEEAPAKGVGRLLCFMPARGGCGGTTVAIHVAAAIARESKQRVLFVDFDFHAGTIDLCLGLRTEFTLADAVRHRSDLDELWHKLTYRWNDVEILAPPPNGFDIAAEILKETPPVFDSATRTYDWVICDLPAAVYTSSVRVFEQAEAIYLVCTPELNSLKLARRKSRELSELGILPETVRMVANRMGDAATMSELDMAKIVGVPVAWGFPNDYEGVNKAIAKQRLVAEGSKLGRQFRSFTRHMLGIADDADQPIHELRNLLSRLTLDRFSSSREEKKPSPVPDEV